jgi:hypothetical protein
VWADRPSSGDVDGGLPRLTSAADARGQGHNTSDLVRRLHALLAEDEAAADFVTQAIAGLSWEELQTVQVLLATKTLYECTQTAANQQQ